MNEQIMQMVLTLMTEKLEKLEKQVEELRKLPIPKVVVEKPAPKKADKPVPAPSKEVKQLIIKLNKARKNGDKRSVPMILFEKFSTQFTKEERKVYASFCSYTRKYGGAR